MVFGTQVAHVGNFILSVDSSPGAHIHDENSTPSIPKERDFEDNEFACDTTGDSWDYVCNKESKDESLLVCHSSVTDGDKLSLVDLHLSNGSGACKEVDKEGNDIWSELGVTVHVGERTSQVIDCLYDPYCVTDTMAYSDVVGPADRRMFFPIYDIQNQLQLVDFSVPNNIQDSVLCSVASELDSNWPVWDSTELREYLGIHRWVVYSGVPNFAGCRIPVRSKFAVNVWREKLLLTNYYDIDICDFLEYGFPIGYTAGVLPVPSHKNHSLSYAFSEHIDKFICTELEHRATLGPFSCNPLVSFLNTSPLNTTAKKGSVGDRRVIMDLSWPWRRSVNDDIVKNMYLGAKVQLQYPSVDDLLDLVVRLGPGCLLLKDLGVGEAEHKAVPPSTHMIFLGVMIDTVDMTISVPPDKYQDIHTVLQRWRSKFTASRKEVQSIIGTLQFAAKCVRPGRIFISRMLRHLRSMTCFAHNEQVPLPSSFLRDVQWWTTFMARYNGVSIIPLSDWSVPDSVVSTDSCLSGCGGFSYSTGEFFHAQFPDFILRLELDINCLELLAIVIALKLWGSSLKGNRINVFCDNQTSVCVLNSGRVRNEFLSACLREVAFLCAVYETHILAVHVEGVNNRLSDLLSRSHLDWSLTARFIQQVGCEMIERAVDDSLFHFTADW